VKKRILFVDDEPNILDGLQRMLRPMRDGWEMSFVTSGPEALEYLGRAPFDVLVTDMRMPGMDGAQLLNIARERYSNLVRIVLSGHSDQELVLKSVRLAHQYLSKPCDSETLRTSVERACGLRDWLGSDTIKQVVGKIDSLPSLPSTYTEMLNLLDDADVTVSKVAAVVSRDVAMVVKVLQLVNSAFFGLRQHISNIGQAANLLGLDTLKTLILSTHIFSQFEESSLAELSIDRIWRHCLKVAIFAKEIAKSEVKDQMLIDDAFMAGMLHDIGKLILAANFREEYVSAREMAIADSLTIQEAEKTVLGAAHPEIGAYLVGLWGLPEPIVEAVAFHHNPNPCLATTLTPVIAVYAANAIENSQYFSTVDVTGDATIADLSVLAPFQDRIPLWREICSKITEGVDDDGQGSFC
jgi:putative nucleotidyltransferase with HDIG domain